MLTRVWDAPEAISAWLELVNEQKLEVEKLWKDEQIVPYNTLMATRQKISQDQVVE